MNIFLLDIHGPKLTMSPSNVIDKHRNVILDCNAESFPPIRRFSWQNNHNPIRNEISKRLIILNTTERDIGFYTCSVNFNGSVYTSSSVSLMVNCK